MTRRRGCLIAAVLLLALSASLCAASGWLLPRLARWLDVGQPPSPTDYVVSLPGDEAVRPFVAAALVNTGLARQALVLQTKIGPKVADGTTPSTQEVIRRVLEARGVPEERIVLLDRGQTSHTHGDATLLANFLESSPDARVTVVTSHYHTRRTRWVFSLVLGDKARQLTFVSAPTDGYTADNWWHRRDGFLSIVGEYLKLAFYAVRYTRFPYAATALAVGAVLVVVFFRRRRQRPQAIRKDGTPPPSPSGGTY